MPIVRLDNTFISTSYCPPDKKKIDFYDEEMGKFLLEVRPSGGRTYYVKYQDETGRTRQRKIGSASIVTLTQARKEAKRLLAEIELGGNPQDERQAKRAIITYAELSKKHLAFIKTQARSYTTIEGYVRRHIIPRWGKKLVSDIKQPDIAAWLGEKKESGLAIATVEKIRVILSRSFELAIKWGIPGVDRNPVKGISLGPINNARDRALSEEESVRLHAAVGASANTQLKYVVGLLLLTGARISELLKAEWRHVDVENRRWLIPTSKTGKHRYVPLSQAAVDLINALPRFKDCKYLVPNPDTKKPFVSIKHSWDTARKAAGVADVRIHDLRHTFASHAVSAGVDLYAVGKVLGHANHASTQRYSHHSQAALLAAVEAGSAKLGGWAA